MTTQQEFAGALDAALVAARGEYRDAVIRIATREAGKSDAPDREPADVGEIHHARTRVLALEAAINELS